MANIFDYLNDVAYDSFYDLPMNELDVLALTELTYLAFDNVVNQEPKRLIDMAPQIPRDTTMLTNKNRLQLLDQLAQHKRFKNCKLSDFINDIDPNLQKNIISVYTFDAPGLHKELTETAGYQNMMERTKVFVPQGSIIGMMLEIPDKKIVVRSTALGGLAQHDTFSWQVEDKHFVQLDETNSDSQQVDTTFKEWVETVPDTELQLYFDLFFGIILDAGISSINDLSSFKVIEHIHHLFIQAQSLTPEERETMGRLTQLLIDTRYQAWKNR